MQKLKDVIIMFFTIFNTKHHLKHLQSLNILYRSQQLKQRYTYSPG